MKCFQRYTFEEFFICISHDLYDFRCVNNFPSTLQDFKVRELAVFIVEILSNYEPYRHNHVR
jgi:hypothetical protein